MGYGCTRYGVSAARLAPHTLFVTNSPVAFFRLPFVCSRADGQKVTIAVQVCVRVNVKAVNALEAVSVSNAAPHGGVAPSDRLIP